MPSERTIADSIAATLRRIARAAELHSHELFHRFGLTGPQLSVLRELEHIGGPASIGTLAHGVHLSSATVTGIVDRLVKQAYVTRIRSVDDKRRVMVALTDAAHDVLRQAPSLLDESFIVELNKLHDWEQNLLLSSLQRLVGLMEHGRKPRAPAAEGAAPTQSVAITETSICAVGPEIAMELSPSANPTAAQPQKE